MHRPSYGYCQCGCGAKTPLRTRDRHGGSKGEPLPYLVGHWHTKKQRWVAEDRGYATPCHIWRLYTMPNGYGQASTGVANQSGLAHRVAWEQARGLIPDGLWVLHKCDVPACVNPDHLFLGTPSDNQYDCVVKRRRISGAGEQHSQARLTWEAVRAIRASGERVIQLARRYGVHPNTIQAVLKGRSWKEPRDEN